MNKYHQSIYLWQMGSEIIPCSGVNAAVSSFNRLQCELSGTKYLSLSGNFKRFSVMMMSFTQENHSFNMYVSWPHTSAAYAATCLMWSSMICLHGETFHWKKSYIYLTFGKFQAFMKDFILSSLHIFIHLVTNYTQLTLKPVSGWNWWILLF